VATRGFGLALGTVAFFVLRNFYFTWFECLWQGSTPGKRLLRLRVIDARGGMLSAEAVFARNLMREVEVFLPLSALLFPQQLAPGAPGWASALSIVWLLAFALLPLFNRDRMRVGDLVAGTRVVRAPRVMLLEDLSGASAPQARGAPSLAFTPEQLDMYGIRELQVLEGLLRQENTAYATLDAVAGQIQKKIGGQRPPGVDAETFLRAFYTAQRQRLEQRLLLGERREAKRAGNLTRRP
jgi:uncharacterized RDD family membrane protein YckC